MRVRAWLGSSLAARTHAACGGCLCGGAGRGFGRGRRGTTPAAAVQWPVHERAGTRRRESRTLAESPWVGAGVACATARPRFRGSSAPYDRSNRDPAGHRLGPGAAGGAGSGQRRGDLVCRVSRRCLGGRRARGGRDRARDGAGVQAAARAAASRRAGAPRSARAARSRHARSGAGGAGVRGRVVDRGPGRVGGLHGVVLARGARRGVGGRRARSRAGCAPSARAAAISPTAASC